jgi:hypothetical protein
MNFNPIHLLKALTDNGRFQYREIRSAIYLGFRNKGKQVEDQCFCENYPIPPGNATIRGGPLLEKAEELSFLG